MIGFSAYNIRGVYSIFSRCACVPAHFQQLRIDARGGRKGFPLPSRKIISCFAFVSSERIYRLCLDIFHFEVREKSKRRILFFNSFCPFFLASTGRARKPFILSGIFPFCSLKCFQWKLYRCSFCLCVCVYIYTSGLYV